MPKIVRFHRAGPADVLQIESEPDRPLGPGEVRLQVEAIGLNRAEIMFREGQYVEAPIFPARIGYEASGIITEVAPDVTDFRPGERAAAIPAFSMNRYGTYGESVVLPVAAMVHTPANLSSAEAAAAWMQYATAYLLIEFSAMRAGDDVLITAAASSVGQAAIQIANAVGARPIATTRKADKVAALLEAGAAAVIDTSATPLAAEVKRLTAGKGARLVFDPIVGAQLPELCEAAAESGDVYLYGALGGIDAPFPLLQALGKNLTLRAYQLSLITTQPERLARAKAWILPRLESGQLKPTIAKIFPLSEIVAAHRFMESNAQVGKIVVSVP